MAIAFRCSIPSDDVMLVNKSWGFNGLGASRSFAGVCYRGVEVRDIIPVPPRRSVAREITWRGMHNNIPAEPCRRSQTVCQQPLRTRRIRETSGRRLCGTTSPPSSEATPVPRTAFGIGGLLRPAKGGSRGTVRRVCHGPCCFTFLKSPRGTGSISGRSVPYGL